MFEHHFGLRENPFPAGHLLKFMYPSREHQEARAHLRYGIENREPFLLITGEVGTGKTTSLYDALNEWGDRVAVALITNSALTRQEMLEEICLRFGLSVPPSTSKPSLMVALERHLVAVRAKGEHAVLMLDEAQNLSMDLLEEIRLLSNLEHRGEKLIQIFLVGQPELEAHLARHELRQLRQRITVHYRLNPLSIDETLGYIHHHINVAGGNGAIMFPAETCRELHRLTNGIPREINTLASASLIAAYADGSPRVTPEHVQAAAQEGDFRSVLAGPPSRPAAAMPPAPAPPTPTPRPQVVAAEPAATAWPPMPQQHAEPLRSAYPPPPVNPAPPAESYAASQAPAAASYSPPPASPAPVAPEPTPSSAPPTPAPHAATPAPPAPEAPTPEPPLTMPRFPGSSSPAWPLPGGAGAYATPRERPTAPASPPVRETPPAREPQGPRAVPPMREAIPGRRERGDVAKGVVAAMRHSEMAKPAAKSAPYSRPAPVPVPARRPTYATPPPVPIPLPDTSERDQEPRGADDLSGLPARLRERLERELAREGAGMPPLRGWLIAVSVLATVGIILILMQRFGAIDVPLLRGPAGTHANQSGSDKPGSVIPAPPATSQAGTATADSLVPVVDPPKPKPAVQTAATRAPASRPTRSRVTSNPNEVGGANTPVPSPATSSRTGGATAGAAAAQRTAASSTASGSTSSAPATQRSSNGGASSPAASLASTTGYGVGVASYLDDARANEESSRLSSATGFPAIVMPFDDAGTTMYRVVLGRWSSSREAERNANGLMERGVINEARVMRLPKQ